MHPLLLALLGPSAVGAVLLVAILCSRYAASRRSLYAPITVVDHRTYRDAVRTVDRAVAAGLWLPAWYGAIAICDWLNYEKWHGRRARRELLAADLEIWSARRDEYNPLAAI